MKVTIEFDNEDEAIQALNASKLNSLIFEFDQYLRGEIKYGDHTEEICDHYEAVRERLHELTNEYGVHI